MYNSEERARLFQKICQWKQSDEYAAINNACIEECAALAEQGMRFVEQIPTLQERIAKTETRNEYATGGDIHRGYYCPSPVITYLIGNIHRGRLLKRISTRSNPSNKYVYSAEGQLLSVETYKYRTIETEYIIEQGNTRYGITVDVDMQLVCFAIETFNNSVLQSYTVLDFITDLGAPMCMNLWKEKYTYDSARVHTCDRQTYDALIGSFHHYCYEFEWQNGSISTYTKYDLSVPEHLRDEFSVVKYYVKPRRA